MASSVSHAGTLEPEPHLQAFVDAIPQGVLIVEPDGRIGMANRSAETLFGYDHGDLAGRNIDLLVPESLRGAHADHRGEFERTPHARMVGSTRDFSARRRDGSEFLAQIGISPWRTERGLHAVACVMDMSVRRKAEDEALAQERAAADAGELSQAIIRDTPLGILMYDGATGACISANAAAASITGVPVDQLLHERFREIVSWQQSGLLPVAEAVLATGEPASRDVQLVTAAGKAIALSCKFLVIPLRGGPHLVLMMDDLTARRDLEAQLRAAQKMEAVGQLAGGVAHDFNNLLTVIGTYTTLMIEGCDANDPRREDLLEVMGAATRAAVLTRQLLAFGRRQLLDSRVLNLNDVVTGLEKMLRRVISAEIELEIVCDPLLGTVHADAGQIEQVLMNLVVNARDAMPRGGRLTIATHDVFVESATGGDGPADANVPMVKLSVTDTGHGMDEVTASRIFEPFFTTKEAGRGSGLGLSTTYGIVKQSGGHVRVRSAPGEGTTFEVMLPRVSERVELVDDTDYSAGDLRGTELILVAEDDQSVRRIVVRTLEKLGYEVIAAADGKEALSLSLLGGRVPDLLLTDVVMPSVSGRELAEALRRRWPALPVLFSSAYATDGTTGDAASNLPGTLLRKPFVPGELAAAVRTALARGAG